MPDKRKPPIRQRPIQVKFFVDEKELNLIKQKMEQMGTDNMSAYLRKIAIDGYIVNLDMPELRELASKMKRISNSENQIAKQLNTAGNIYEVDIEEILRLQSEETIRVYKKRLTQAEKRIGELDRLFIKIYEDNAKGKLNDDRFAMMSKTYEDEQVQLKVEIVNLQKEIEVQERQIEDLEQFIQRARRYTDLTELTPYALRELVKAVYV